MSKKPKLKTINYKLITIVGPTASGKSDLAVKIAKKFNGEIISADSRQVYRGMDIGTGKVPRDKSKIKYQKSKIQIKNKKNYFHQGIQHYLLDVASPKRRFTVVQYRKLVLEAIDKVFKKGKPRTTFHKNALEKPETKKVVRGKIPILCGGTGFYIQAVVDGLIIPEVKPDWKLRKELEKKSVEELYQILKKLDPKRAKTIERQNKRRLIRALEIVKKIGRVPILKKRLLPYPVLMIGIKKEKKELSSLIRKRFFKWLKEGFLKEVLKLKKLGLSWQKIEEFGIHYRTTAQYLQNKITEKEMIENSLRELQNYVKRQITWFKKYAPKTLWIKDYKQAEKLVKEFLKK